jgi:hypothetical protein
MELSDKIPVHSKVSSCGFESALNCRLKYLESSFRKSRTLVRTEDRIIRSFAIFARYLSTIKGHKDIRSLVDQ